MITPHGLLKFTPLEFETHLQILHRHKAFSLEFTPLEFETKGDSDAVNAKSLEFTPLEFETGLSQSCQVSFCIRIYSVGV